MEKRCALCGRKMLSNSSILGLTCLKKMCLQVGITDIKNLSGINLLNDKILILSNKSNLPTKQTSYLADRYLTLSLLNEIELDEYNSYKEAIKADISLITKATKLSELTSFNTITLKQAAEINKQYNTFFNKLMNGEYDDIQELSVTLIKFAFSSYYSKKEYLSDITQKLQYFILMCGVVGLRNASFNFSADCLEHSLQQNPDDLEITNINIIEKIKENNEFKEKVSNIVEKYSETDSFNTKDNSESFSFNNGDLFYALHNVYIDVSGKKQLDNSWYLEIVLSDTYDFTELKKIEDYINNEDFIKSFGNAFINNFALIATSCKVLNPYNITIKFTIDNWK